MGKRERREKKPIVVALVAAAAAAATALSSSPFFFPRRCPSLFLPLQRDERRACNTHSRARTFR